MTSFNGSWIDCFQDGPWEISRPAQPPPCLALVANPGPNGQKPIVTQIWRWVGREAERHFVLTLCLTNTKAEPEKISICCASVLTVQLFANMACSFVA